MNAETRRQELMNVLMESGGASVDDLSVRFGVSRMTIHRDLDELEQSGLLRKVRGGASIQSSSKFESDFRYRERQAAPEKRRIAMAAAQYIEPGQTIMIDDGSTAAAIADHLGERLPLTVITSNLAVITRLAGQHGIDLIALGGRYNKKFHGFFGIVGEEALRSLRADIAFMSTSAIHGAAAFHQDQELVNCKRLMIRAAAKRYLLVDHAKFGRSALHFLSDLSAFDAVLTGGKLEFEIAAPLHAAGINLRIIKDGAKDSKSG